MCSCHVCLEGVAINTIKVGNPARAFCSLIFVLILALLVDILLSFLLALLQADGVSCFFILSQLLPLTLSPRVPLFLRLTPHWNASSLPCPHGPQQAAKAPYKGTGKPNTMIVVGNSTALRRALKAFGQTAQSFPKAGVKCSSKTVLFAWRWPSNHPHVMEIKCKSMTPPDVWTRELY